MSTTVTESTFPGDIRAKGRVIAGGGVDVGTGSITDANIVSGAGVQASKLQHQHQLIYRQEGTVVAATGVPIHITRGDGTIVGIKATVLTPATGGDRTITIDLKAGSSGVAFATQLTGTIGFTNADTALAVKTGTLIGDPSFAPDETLELTVAVAGAAGAQAAGLIIEVTVREDADP